MSKAMIDPTQLAEILAAIANVAVTVSAEDIEIGAVEGKDGVTDTRWKIGAGTSLVEGDNALAVRDPKAVSSLVSILAKIIAAPATEAKQDTSNTSLATVVSQLTTLLAQTDGLEAALATLTPPENEEVVALASAKDTTSGRTSEVFVNKHARGLVLMVSITGHTGTGTIDSVSIFSHGSEWLTFEDLGFTSNGIAFLTCYPGIAEDTDTFRRKSRPAPQQFTIKTLCTTDNAGNDITYSVTVVHLL
jgi:hypothetical protein